MPTKKHPELRVGYGSSGEMRAEIQRWLDTLSVEQRMELTHLDARYTVLRALPSAQITNELQDEVDALRGITRDWIEEHGGHRSYWSYICVDVE